jgi:hypothetical protein
MNLLWKSGPLGYFWTRNLLEKTTLPEEKSVWNVGKVNTYHKNDWDALHRRPASQNRQQPQLRSYLNSGCTRWLYFMPCNYMTQLTQFKGKVNRTLQYVCVFVCMCIKGLHFKHLLKERWVDLIAFMVWYLTCIEKYVVPLGTESCSWAREVGIRSCVVLYKKRRKLCKNWRKAPCIMIIEGIFVLVDCNLILTFVLYFRMVGSWAESVDIPHI